MGTAPAHAPDLTAVAAAAAAAAAAPTPAPAPTPVNFILFQYV